MKYLICLLVTVALATGIYAQPAPQVPWAIQGKQPSATELDLLKQSLLAGQKRIEQFFGRPFAKPFGVEVFPHRSHFDEYFIRRWKVPKTQSWMVASGVADKLTILSRDVWKKEASEHHPEDANHYRELIAHEMVHVYHGQMNPTGDFEGMDDVGWFVEGLAVYVSGQLEQSHRTAADDAIRLGKAPTSLAKAWSGRYRYGVCGSLVRYIDQKWGRDKVKSMLAATQLDGMLKTLDVTETELLQGWQRSVKETKGP